MSERDLAVLVVDDEDDARELMAELLGGCGLAVSTAGSAAEALDALTRDHPDLIVSDIGMPKGLSGRRFVRGTCGVEAIRTPSLRSTR